MGLLPQRADEGREVSALIHAQDRPAVELNRDVMARYRPAMRALYYNPAKYRTYLEQLGITYPTERAADGSCAGSATP